MKLVTYKNTSPLIHFVIATLLFPLFLPQITSASEIIEVKKIVWTNEIGDDKSYKTEFIDSAPLAPLYFWTTVVGKREALALLKKNGKLPIRHKWYRMIGYKVYSDQPEGGLVDAIDLSVGKEEKTKELEQELSERNYFDWRTWSMKENIKSGWWLVKIVYSDDSPVICYNSDEKKKCEFWLEVK